MCGCVYACVCVCKGGSLPLLSFYLSYLLVLIDVLLIDPVAVRAAPLREASRDPSPCALTGPGGALLPFGSPWGSQRQHKETYLILAPRLLRPQLLLLLLPLLFPCFYSAVLTKKIKYIIHFTLFYTLFVLFIQKKKKTTQKN